MKAKLLLSVIAIALFCSCKTDNRQPQQQPQPETPKALSDKKIVDDVVYSKRSGSDLVEDLYAELAEKTPELKDVDNKIKVITESRSDSSESFNNYDGKSKQYYHNAERKIDNIKDSVIKQKVLQLIAKSQVNYESKTAKYKELIHLIDSGKTTLQDLYVVLKITRTLTLIQKYQQDNLPSKKPLQTYYNKLEATKELADSLAKK